MASGADTHTHAYIRTEVISGNQANAGLWPARAWFKYGSNYVACYMRMEACPRTYTLHTAYKSVQDMHM